jgi:hypothetical protein
LNEIACNWNWIENLIPLYSNSQIESKKFNLIIELEFKFYWIGLNSNLKSNPNPIQIRIESKTNWIHANWCKQYWNFVWVWCWLFLKIHKSKNTPFHSSLLGNWLNKFYIAIIIQKNELWNLICCFTSTKFNESSSLK